VMGSGDDFKVRELIESSSGLCGGTFIDESFMRYLFKMIGCLESYLDLDDPSYKLILLNRWEEIKRAFGLEANLSTELYQITLPGELARRWTGHEDMEAFLACRIKLSQMDMESIFNPVVDDVLKLIAAQLIYVQGIKTMFVVGGFASSPYLMQRIRTCFSHEIEHIFCPYDPRSAIMQGAISLALTANGIGA
jgi:hypothetical protein